jgi:hypothetical protein
MDLIGFDACLMGMIEVAYELRDSGAGVMVGSEETVAFDGWPYDTILDDLISNPAWGQDSFGIAIVNRFDEYYLDDYTHSAIDLTAISSLGDAISSFSDAMRTYWDSDKLNIRPAAQSVMDGIDIAVLEEGHSTSLPNSYGLAIYFPSTEGDFSHSYDENRIDFASDTSWDEFLSDFYTSMDGSWVDIARSFSQEYSESDHIDLFDFCNNILIYSDPATMIADAGDDQTVNDGDTVSLDGSGSTIPAGVTPTYLWEQTAGPLVTLSDNASVQPTFTAPDITEFSTSLTFSLTISDGGGLESTDTCIVRVIQINEPPVADAGDDQTVDEGDQVTLDGTGSTGSDDSIVAYLWAQTSGFSVTLSDETAAQPTFTAPDVDDAGGTLTFRLTVTDAGGLKASDNSTVNVASVADSPSRSSSGGGCFIGSVFDR